MSDLDNFSDFDADTFLPTEAQLEELDENATLEAAGSEMFPGIRNEALGSDQDLSGATGRLVEHVEEILDEKSDAQITEVILSQLIFMLCKNFTVDCKCLLGIINI